MSVKNPLDLTNRCCYYGLMKISRWRKYDKGSGLWISSSKPVYGYWFRFLHHTAKDSARVVDWSAYEGWGGEDVILRTTQNDWWKKNWKTLFGYEQDETKPLYSLSKAPSGEMTRPQPDCIRFALMVYELRDTPLFNGQLDKEDGKVGDKWEIAKRIAKWEYPRRKAKAKKTLPTNQTIGCFTSRVRRL